MLHLSRARRRSALGLVAFAVGCAQSTPPAEAPLEASQSATARDLLQEPAPEEEEVSPEPASPQAQPSEATTPAAPASQPHAPRDARGKEQIQQVMGANRDKVRACYDASLVKNPGIQGDLVVDFVIDRRGAVKQAEVNWSASEIHIPELDSCAADAVRALKFPASSRGLESKVSYPFNFNPPRNDPPPKDPPSKKP